MTSILTSEKLQECLEARNDVAIHILSVVKDASEVFPPLRLAAEKALSIAIKVRVSNKSYAPIDHSPELSTSRNFGRASGPGRNSGTMSRRRLAKLYCGGRSVNLVQGNPSSHGG